MTGRFAPPALSLACLFGLAALAAPAAQAQTTTAAAPKPAPCQAPEQRQFDFWVGRWHVFNPAGKQVGENLIEVIDDGCALLERWRGQGGFSGSSLNSWNATTRQWHQHWVDNQGSMLRLAGAFEGGRMVLASNEPNPDKPGTLLRQRITWTALADGAVRQLWEQSANDGASWDTAFDGRYVRQK